jgi:hypothetical protein
MVGRLGSSGYQDAVGALVFCGLASAIRCALSWMMSRWMVNVTPKYSSNDAEPQAGLRTFAVDEIKRGAHPQDARGLPISCGYT